MARDRNDVRMCNCALCTRPLLGDSERVWWEKLTAAARGEYPEPVAGRVAGRPYCGECLEPSHAGGVRIAGGR